MDVDEISLKVPEGIRTPKTNEECKRGTFEMMKKHNILGVVSGEPYNGEWKRDLPDRIIAGRTVMELHTTPVNELRKALKEKRYEVIGEVGNQYFGIAPNDPVLDPYWGLAEELDAPVCIHTGMGPPDPPNFLPTYRAHLSNPLLYEDVIIRHPKVRIWLAHAGWPYVEDLLNMMWHYPQIHVDVSFIDWCIAPKEFHRYLGRIVDAGFCDRVMFGSDQMKWPDAIPYAINAVRSAEYLTGEQKQDILLNNAARFLRLDVD